VLRLEFHCKGDGCPVWLRQTGRYKIVAGGVCVGGGGESGEAGLALQQAGASSRTPRCVFAFAESATDVVVAQLFCFFDWIAFGDPVRVEIVGEDQNAEMGEAHIAEGYEGWTDIGAVG
jgi:hypothetical protein